MNGKKVGLLFGPERTGLSNEDLSVATHIITIPVDPDFSSLNIAEDRPYKYICFFLQMLQTLVLLCVGSLLT